MMFFQVKAIRKGTKPPVWRRCYIPSGITFTQLALLLEVILELPETERFEIEFYGKKERLIEWKEDDEEARDFYYSYRNASDTCVDEWLMNEPWFTFRIRGRKGEYPEYRVEVEKALENITFRNAEEKQLNYPLIIKESSLQNDPYWSDGREMNRHLEETYFLMEAEAHYHTFAQVQEVRDRKQGIETVREMVSRDIHGRKSANVLLGELTEQLQNQLFNRASEEMQKELRFDQDTDEILSTKEEQEAIMERSIARAALETQKNMKKELKERFFLSGGNTVHHANLEEMLKSYTKQELNEIADELHYQLKAGKKDGMAFELARFLLEPQTMRELLLEADEEELDAFEAAMKKGCYRPSDEERQTLTIFMELNYMADFVDDRIEVPTEVRMIYGILLRNGYREFHTKAEWLLVCLRAFDLIHVVAPVKILYRMYRQNKSVAIGFEEFMELLQKMPDRLNPCCLTEGRIVGKEAMQEKVYRKIEKRQRDVEYAVPSMTEIISFAEDGYPSCEKAYGELFTFFSCDMELDPGLCEELCVAAFRIISMGGGLSDYMDVLYKNDLVFNSDGQLERFAGLYMEAHNHTRMFELRGHMPSEMRELFPSVGGAKRPTIVPMSSQAAELLEEGRAQLAGMGISVDTGQSATTIPVFSLPEGVQGEVRTMQKKVYPNDPCPCGSGKKFKKCCGRK